MRVLILYCILLLIHVQVSKTSAFTRLDVAVHLCRTATRAHVNVLLTVYVTLRNITTTNLRATAAVNALLTRHVNTRSPTTTTCGASVNALLLTRHAILRIPTKQRRDVQVSMSTVSLEMPRSTSLQRRDVQL